MDVAQDPASAAIALGVFNTDFRQRQPLPIQWRVYGGWCYRVTFELYGKPLHRLQRRNRTDDPLVADLDAASTR